VTLAKVFGTPDGDLQAAFSPVNSVYWTLAIEFQFYLCMYLALLARRYFHLLIGLVTGASLLLIARPLPLDAGWFIHYWPMFAVGIALQYLLAAGWGSSAGCPGGRGGLRRRWPAGCSWGAGAGLPGHAGAGAAGGVPVGRAGFCGGLRAAAGLAAPSGSALEAHRDRGHPVLRWLLKPAAYLGVISYSVYLLHGKLVQLPAMVVRQVLRRRTRSTR
jgi:peptidoglycan/LPS O-acetylase OafA/YrhL